MNKKPAPDPLLETIGVTAKLIIPCYSVAAENTVTIVTAFLVRISSMDAQTNKLFLKKTRIKWTDSILV